MSTALGLAFATGCSGKSKSNNATPTSSTTDKTCQQATDCILPPTQPSGPKANGTSPVVLAIKKLYLGDLNKQDQPDPGAWKSLGYNLDGLETTATGTNHCKPQPGANPQVMVDGNGGIDNSFGENLLPIITSLASNASQSVNQSIANGSFTVMVKMDNVDSQANQTDVMAELYGGGNLGNPPNWDGNDKWPVVYELLNNGNEQDPKVKFPHSFVADNTWVSGSQGTLSLSLSVQGYALTLNIVKAVITMKLAADRQSATEGIIAGVINTETLVNELRNVAGSFQKSLCSGPTFDSIAQEIKAASDIMSDGTAGSPTQTCDAISIGLGFDASAVQLGKVLPPAKVAANPCAAGGAGGSAGSGSGGGAGTGAGGSSAGGSGAGGAGGADGGI